jgi:polyisoprenoid-binding protein YceI
MLLVAFVLAACAPAAPQAADPTAAPTTQASVPTLAPTSTAMPAGLTPTAPTLAASTAVPTAAAATQPAAQGGNTTYNIIPGESKVTYEVGETFLNQNNRFNLAVGVTTQVTGSVIGDKNNPSTVTLGTFEIDISKFTSDSTRRDGYIRGNGLESSKYPIAKFVPTRVETLPGAYTEGQDVSIKVTGDLTIKTTTRPVTWDVTTRLANGVLTGKATTELLMSEFNVGPISILGVLNTEDKVKLIFDFVAKP